MYAKGKAAPVPSDSQAREKLALYVYEYLLHVGAQKSAQTFLSEIRWEKNITLGEPPGFLHSWWCVFWDLYCASPERRETCDHSSEAKAFHDYGPPGSQMSPHGHPPPSHTPNAPPMMGHHGQPFMPSRYPGGARPHPRMATQAPGGMPGPQSLLHNTMDPRNPGHPVIAGPMQRMAVPRGLVAIGPQGYAGGLRPALPNALGAPPITAMSMGPGGRSWPNPTSITYSAPSPGNYGAPPGSGPPGTPIMPSPGDSNSSDMYSMMNPVAPGNRPSFQMGPGGEGPMVGLSGMAGMEPHPMNGSLGSGEMDGIPKNSPPNLSSLSNAPGTPRDDGEIPVGFLNAFPSDGVRPFTPARSE
uniref:single-stranded DNA-binding protein 3-like isoform X2 n=1 Tax=Myxine glutinosa TaxID=7769 RepID=UPI0035900783